MSTKEDDSILEELIASGRLSIEDFDEINSLSTNLLDKMIVDTPQSMDKRFYDFLALQNKKSKSITWKSFSFAASVILLLGFFGGYMFNKHKNSDQSDLTFELNKLKEEVVISKLDNQSTSARLQAVGLTQEMSEVSIKITNALLFTINNDPSDNVRIASIEALIPFGKLEEVRSGLINAIPQQKSPLVLISLAEALQKIGAV
ncbi:MAG: hypothetical protein KDC53_21900, partial [Saprospiraceae bacterium]|nr:hypothetical protein [Saprospiraceae bacterium]